MEQEGGGWMGKSLPKPWTQKIYSLPQKYHLLQPNYAVCLR